MWQHFVNSNRDSQFWESCEYTSIVDSGLLMAALELPRKNNVVQFIDLDDTLLDGKRRYEIMPELKNFSWSDAYPEIAKKFWTQDDLSWIKAFVKALDPKNHLFGNITKFYSPNDPNQIILTAWDYFFQWEKIRASFGENVQSIIVEHAQDKPNAMLEYFISKKFLPSEIIFYDDRIEIFRELRADFILSKTLGIPVFFLKAIPDHLSKTVYLEKKSLEMWRSIRKMIEGVFLDTKNAI